MTCQRSLLTEVLAFCAVALLLALANAFLNPGAMALDRDYFPSSGDPTPAVSSPGGKPVHEFQVADLEQMQADLEFFAAPEGDILCLDARAPELYAAAHIPGARLLYHYRADDYVSELLPDLQAAAMIIIYCAGGDCEDSIFLARDLVYVHGIDKEVLWIYEGGMEEWQAESLEVEEGV